MSVLNPPLFKSDSKTTKKDKSVPFFKDRFLGGLMLANSATEPADVISRVADSNARLSLTAEGVVVSGAGSVLANSTYTQRGISNGKPYYNQTSESDSLLTHQIAWDGTQWTMYGALYVSPDDTATPDLATFVPAASHGGSLPAPTVTHSPGQVTGAGYQVYQEDLPPANNPVTFNGDGADADAGLWVKDAGEESQNGAYAVTNPSLYSGVTNGQSCEYVGHPIDLSWGFATLYLGEDVTYAWQTVTWTIGAGASPAPTVIRNPIASESNWSHP